jgi:hypothetical protein
MDSYQHQLHSLCNDSVHPQNWELVHAGTYSFDRHLFALPLDRLINKAFLGMKNMVHYGLISNSCRRSGETFLIFSTNYRRFFQNSASVSHQSSESFMQF